MNQCANLIVELLPKWVPSDQCVEAAYNVNTLDKV